MLYHRCPMCGNEKFTIEKVVSWPFAHEAEPRDYIYLAGVDKGGNACCSYNDYQYSSREAADWAALNFTSDMLEDLDCEKQSDALAVTDEHGYFMDYWAYDSYE